MANADGMFNIARGATKWYYDAVENSRVLATAGQFTSTANAAFVLLLLELSGLVADDTLADYDDLAALLAGASNEPSGGNYARKVIDDAALAAVPAPDDTNNRLDLDLPDQTFTTLSTTGNAAIGKAVLVFRPDTGSADSACIPVTYYDVDFTPDGVNDVQIIVAATGFYRSA